MKTLIVDPSKVVFNKSNPTLFTYNNKSYQSKISECIEILEALMNKHIKYITIYAIEL